MSNKIGKRGESIFSTIISRNIASRGFLLDPTFLGDKFPTVDFHVGLSPSIFLASMSSQKRDTLSPLTTWTTQRINGISTNHPVNGSNIGVLWDEVAAYWNNSQQLPKFLSNFTQHDF